MRLLPLPLLPRRADLSPIFPYFPPFLPLTAPLWHTYPPIIEQDIFLLSSPGPFTRRLALTFLNLLNSPYEIVSLHRDVSENELKQARELRKGGRLEYVDSGAVRAAKNGSVLVLDGIERVRFLLFYHLFPLSPVYAFVLKQQC